MSGRLQQLAVATPISQPIAPMRNLGVLIAACLISAPCHAAEVTRTTEDRCSLAVAAIEDRASIVCDGVGPKALARLNTLLNERDLQLHEKVAEAEAWARSYRELNGRLELDIPAAGAAQLLKEGKLEDAGAVLDQLIGSDEIDIDRLAGHHYDRAQIYALQLDPLLALPHYASAYNDRPEVLLYALGYAQSLHRNSRHEEAGQIYQRALQLARKQAKLDATATILNNLGNLYTETQRLNEAESPFLEALDIYRHLAQTNPADYLPDVATTLSSLGNLYGDTQRLQEGADAFREALAIRRQLAKTKPARYLPDVATVLNNLGILYRNADSLEEAENAYREALDIRRQLARTSPMAYLPYVATTLNNLGVLYRNTERLQEAEDAYREALGGYRELAKIKSSVYLPDVAMALNNLGVLYRNTQRLTEAERAFNEALAIRRQLAKNNPATYLPYVGNTLNNLGALYRDTQRMREAENTLLEAREIRAELAAKNPSVYTRNLVQTLRNLQELYNQMGRTDDAQHIADQLQEVGSPASAPLSR